MTMYRSSKNSPIKDASNLKQRIELCKMMIAVDAMESVAEAARLIEKLGADHTHPLYKALHDAIVTSYGRAFTEMRPLGLLSKKWSEFKDDELNRAHAMLMYYRHKNVSHTDVIKGRVIIYPKGAKLDEENIAPRAQYGVLMQSFAPNELIAVQKVAGTLTGRLTLEIGRKMALLYGDEGKDLREVTDLVSEEELNQLSLELKQKKNARRSKSKQRTT